MQKQYGIVNINTIVIYNHQTERKQEIGNIIANLQLKPPHEKHPLNNVVSSIYNTHNPLVFLNKKLKIVQSHKTTKVSLHHLCVCMHRHFMVLVITKKSLSDCFHIYIFLPYLYINSNFVIKEVNYVVKASKGPGIRLRNKRHFIISISL